MAFPTIQTGDTQSGTQTSNSNSWTLTYPTNLANGDLILAFVSMDGTPVPTMPANWVVDNDAVFGSGANRGWAFKKKSDGTETGNFTMSLTASEQGAWRIFRITGWEGTLGTQFDNTTDTGAVAFAQTGSGSSANPDPPSLNPATWDVEDTLWFAVCSVDTSRTISVYPLADNQTADVSGGAGGATLGICTANDAVASKDPGTFTISTSDDWGAGTIAVRPAAPPVETSPHRRIHHVSRLAAMDRAGSW